MNESGWLLKTILNLSSESQEYIYFKFIYLLLTQKISLHTNSQVI